jgi:hypothetical protein
VRKLSVEMHKKFEWLACSLSPENLHCDGEISRSAARKKAVTLRKRWRELEKEVGRRVSEEEVWR